MPVKTLNVNEDILSANDLLAENLKAKFDNSRVFVMNLMSSPGAGKTSLILRIIEALSDKFKIGVIEGDIASDVDAQKVQSTSVDVVQINTKGACHLDANMILSAAGSLGLDGKQLVIIENVGNLVCPAEFKLGEDVKVMILSIPEGHDKPLKYPLMFTESNALVLNKIDLLPYTDFSMEELRKTVLAMNPSIQIFPVSAKTGEGMDKLTEWLGNKISAK
ncbi:hydrogenase nickel incorporation protein HypB [Desulfomonile tiedjei]|uniref:Ni2+-binding GTPase, urease/hydrogenase maturation protein n=1 Tax=Desulfomonile tiedjei (strain ATCC 49306 / DSM 6799 / DCB-1) TaxID=706587 RepID=I4CF77_DESTA|nr:hydrogenase nickel incorporation protein HypB [Desulfomonile tiedjei]AFM28218.1 Ni2+-binding GTPase, urease/hydrogenase maturation protein [Desulfomonile tiedjei DSM 6799]